MPERPLNLFPRWYSSFENRKDIQAIESRKGIPAFSLLMIPNRIFIAVGDAFCEVISLVSLKEV